MKPVPGSMKRGAEPPGRFWRRERLRRAELRAPWIGDILLVPRAGQANQEDQVDHQHHQEGELRLQRQLAEAQVLWGRNHWCSRSVFSSFLQPVYSSQSSVASSR